ncbi:hypothetical protein [Staphylococcus felis]|uniref:Uncharacterized protein n=1 Tax=Staphylococcus felis TaxID=46127 RepID=A0ABS0QLL6_9STAP|nr:hypothetical protein [Staphylococcus felis]AVP37453.1 hypothetical protein C7J90_10985 [Staphylococcus felis]MBH9580096.1 hypothetical protein [Staphylococcus felis]PNZ36239.1 hypothetical protein CD143_04535 [Staphylococcus felis]QQB02597.1 hypothetical protein I6H71_07515 [Staphylococcus felis]REI09508.1 hypothetical protein DOS69_01855 [Staphylococcus felis]
MKIEITGPSKFDYVKYGFAMLAWTMIKAFFIFTAVVMLTEYSFSLKTYTLAVLLTLTIDGVFRFFERVLNITDANKTKIDFMEDEQ